MLAYIPQNMSRKRSIPFRATTADHCEAVPMPKRARGAAGRSARESGNSRAGEHHSLDVFVLPQAPRSRRVASLKAQIANTSLLIAEHRQHSRSASPHEIPTPASEQEEAHEDVLVQRNWGGPSLTSNASRRPQAFQEKISQPKRESVKSEQIESCSSSLSPLSSLGSEWEEEREVDDILLKGPTASTEVKDKALSSALVSEKKSPLKRKNSKSTKVSVSKKPLSPPSQGYVRRMASLNARACVSAIMDTGKRPYKRKSAGSTPKSSANTTSSVLPQSECQSQEMWFPDEPKSVSQSPKASPHRRDSSDKESVLDDSSLLNPFVGKGPGYVLVCASPNTLTRCGIIRDSDESSLFNTEGQLWNGDTVHPQCRVYLTPEGEVPRFVVPPICPARPHLLPETKELVRAWHQRKIKKPKAVKGDNGWYAMGNPIKEVQLPHKDEVKVVRKYYAGIRRRNEELWVRDCITVKSGKRKQDRPYIAKIGSIWRENNGSVNMTLFWYYRPEEAVGIATTDFQTDEVLASQHYDDNSVACIEDKCYVLGLRQYCRYLAQCKRVKEGIGSLDSFSVIQADPIETGQQLGRTTAKHKQSKSLVFLCHRGYNHIAGRLLKSYK